MVAKKYLAGNSGIGYNVHPFSVIVWVGANSSVIGNLLVCLSILKLVTAECSESYIQWEAVLCSCLASVGRGF